MICESCNSTLNCIVGINKTSSADVAELILLFLFLVVHESVFLFVAFVLGVLLTPCLMPFAVVGEERVGLFGCVVNLGEA